MILVLKVKTFNNAEKVPPTQNDNSNDGDVVNTEGDQNFFIMITAEELEVDMQKCNNLDVVHAEEDMKFDVTIKTGDLEVAIER